MNSSVDHVPFFERMKAHWVPLLMPILPYCINKVTHRLQRVRRFDWCQTSAGGSIGMDVEFKMSAREELTSIFNTDTDIFDRGEEIRQHFIAWLAFCGRWGSLHVRSPQELRPSPMAS